MGQRANFIIIQNHEYQLYYSHWGANTLTKDLFWGVEHAISFVRLQREVGDSGWLDDIWGEGAAVIDCDNNVLLLFGGEDLLYDVPLRRTYLDLLHRTWDSWEIRWADEGIAEIADYVGYPRIKVLSKQEEDANCSLSPPEERDWTDIVGSFQLSDGKLRLYPLDGDVECYLLTGANLVTQCEHSSSLDEWHVASFPNGGFHVDVAARTLEYWSGKDLPGIPERVAAKWMGWNITWHGDNYEFQLNATAGKLQFATRSQELLQTQLKDMLLGEYGKNPVDTIIEIARKEGAEINSWALENPRLEVAPSERQRIVTFALEGKHID